MVEQLPKRPAGGRESDLKELNDWTITDIATAPNTDPKDRANAEAEIARREVEGVYDPDGSPKDIRKDFSEHGYGIEDGKILYPQEEYLEWLDSDRTGPIPTTLRETIDDRLRNEDTYGEASQDATEERLEDEEQDLAKRDLLRQWGEFAMDKYGDDEYTQPKKISKSLHDYRAAKQRERDRNNPNYAHKSEMLLPGDKLEQFPEDIEKNIQAESEGAPEISVEQKFGRAVDYAKLRLKKTNRVNDYYIEGALSNIEKGNFKPNNNYVYNGLKTLEGDRIDEIAGSKDNQMIWDAIGEHVPFISKEQLRSLEKEAVVTAIEIGAYRKQNGIMDSGEVVYTLPLQTVGESGLSDTIASFGLGYQTVANEETSPEEAANAIEHNEKVYSMFESGFVGIIDALKDGGTFEDERAFDVANWYYEHLLAGHNSSHIRESVNNKYVASEDEDFIKTFNEFISRRIEKQKESPESEPAIDQLDGVDEATLNGLRVQSEVTGDLEAFSGDAIASVILNNPDMRNIPGILEIFPQLGTQTHKTRGKNRLPKRARTGYGAKKYLAFMDFLDTLSQRSDFSAGPDWIEISRPFHIYRDESGKWVSESAHYDVARQCFVDNSTNHKIADSSVRLYIGARFQIGGKDRFVTESITDATERAYVSIDDAAKNYSSVYSSSKQSSMIADAQGNPLTFRFNHTPFTLDGTKGLHSFQKMYARILRKIA
jgi:hypothetical protein